MIRSLTQKIFNWRVRVSPRFGAPLVLALVLFAPGPAGAEVVDRIVAVVNDEIISLFELERMVAPYAERVRAMGYPEEEERRMLFQVRQDILNQLINQRLTAQETKKSNISVNQEEIDQALERIKESNYYTDEQLRAALEDEGFSLEEYRERLGDQILRSKLMNREIKSKIVITDEEIKAYYEANREDYSGEEQYHLRSVLPTYPALADEADRRETRRRMEDIVRKVKEGGSFETLASLYSDSPLADDGGDLGTFALADLSPEIREAVDGLKEGETTPILDAGDGLQVIFIEEIISRPSKSLEDARPEIEEALFNEVVNERFEAWLKDLREQSHIKIIQ
ncbi:MAG: SurA N-terminal domain-containing protein [Desulfococcaceae bacterium]